MIYQRLKYPVIFFFGEKREEDLLVLGEADVRRKKMQLFAVPDSLDVLCFLEPVQVIIERAAG